MRGTIHNRQTTKLTRPIYARRGSYPVRPIRIADSMTPLPIRPFGRAKAFAQDICHPSSRVAISGSPLRHARSSTSVAHQLVCARDARTRQPSCCASRCTRFTRGLLSSIRLTRRPSARSRRETCRAVPAASRGRPVAPSGGRQGSRHSPRAAWRRLASPRLVRA